MVNTRRTKLLLKKLERSRASQPQEDNDEREPMAGPSTKTAKVNVICFDSKYPLNMSNIDSGQNLC